MTNNPARNETYISVDVETAGPHPAQYALLAIGACTVLPPPATFYVELQPEKMDATPQALDVSHLSLEKLAQDGLPPAEAMRRFAAWVGQVTPPGSRPVFVALNAPFDWMFVNDAFHRHLGYNPFGHSALDIKALFMGQTGSPWQETSFRHLTEHLQMEARLTHNALQDARDQAEVFRRLLAEQGTTRTEP